MASGGSSKHIESDKTFLVPTLPLLQISELYDLALKPLLDLAAAGFEPDALLDGLAVPGSPARFHVFTRFLPS